MKIKDTRVNNKYLFSEVSRGSVFGYNNMICQKLDEDYVFDELTTVNLIDLTSGALGYIRDCDEVEIVDAELVVKWGTLK